MYLKKNQVPTFFIRLLHSVHFREILSGYFLFSRFDWSIFVTQLVAKHMKEIIYKNSPWRGNIASFYRHPIPFRNIHHPQSCDKAETFWKQSDEPIPIPLLQFLPFRQTHAITANSNPSIESI
jgi:hypothetical protein